MFIAAELDGEKGWEPKPDRKGRTMKSVERRIQALEARLSSDAVILHFADGSTQELRGPRYFLLDLINAAGRTDISASQAAQLEAVRRSLFAEEPGGGHLTEVIRILPEFVEEEETEAFI
jgi:hypothetical protein